MKHLLESWRLLNAPGALNTLEEAQVLDLLIQERDTLARYDFVLRLHQRYCELRKKRERDELMKLVK